MGEAPQEGQGPPGTVEPMMMMMMMMMTLHADQCAYLVISCSVLLILRNVSDKRYRENQNTHFTFNNFSENRAVYEIMINIFRVGQVKDDKIIQRMLIACRIPMATGTHSEYVILIVMPLQQWLHESASM